MKDFNEIGKNLPYAESEEYVSELVERCANRAIAATPALHKRNIVRRISYYATTAAAAAAVTIIMVMHFSQPSPLERVEKSAALPQVLSKMSDEQVKNVEYYTVDDIPEY